MNSITTNGNLSQKQSSKLGIFIFAFLAMLYILVGLFGAIKEHFCLSCTYTVLSVFLFILIIIQIPNDGTYWGGFFWLIICIVSVLFTHDLNKIRPGVPQAII